jgi:hypothetical protein
MMRSGRTDEQLLAIELDQLIAGGLHSTETARDLFADGAVAAAIEADRLDVQPRSIAFLAEIVRRGGIPYADALPEPLPGAAQTVLARRWLAAAAGGDAITFARWLDAVAAIVQARRSGRVS